MPNVFITSRRMNHTLLLAMADFHIAMPFQVKDQIVRSIKTTADTPVSEESELILVKAISYKKYMNL